jgi:putative ABC transport system permease protein
MLRNNLKIALRSLVNNKVYSLINVGGLSLGLTVAILLLMWVQNELNFDGYHRKASRIYLVVEHLRISDTETWHWATTPYNLGEEIAVQIPDIMGMTRYMAGYDKTTLKVNEQNFQIGSVAFVEPSFFKLFDIEILAGSLQDVFAHPNSIILSEAKAKQFFGTEQVLGRTILFEGKEQMVVRGIMANPPPQSSFQQECLIPLAYKQKDKTNWQNNDLTWGNFNYNTFVELREGASLPKVEALLDKIMATKRPNKDDKGKTLPPSDKMELEALTQMHFNEQLSSYSFPTGDFKMVMVFALVAFLILLVASINYVNMTTARASLRAKEVGLKKIIGAAQGQLFRQFFTESLLYTFLALALSVLAVQIALPFFNDFTGQHFSLSLRQPLIWQVVGATVALTIVFTGVYPSLLLSSFRPLQVLKGYNLLRTSNSTFRKGLMVVQFTITIVLIVAVAAIYQQMQFIKNAKPDANIEEVFTIILPWQESDRSEVLRRELSQQGGVLGVSRSSQPLVSINSTHSGSLDWDGRAPDFQPSVAQLMVDMNFGEMFKLKIAEGRWFSEKLLTDTANVIINQTAARTFGFKGPAVGRRFKFQGKEGRIVGVVKDFHFRSVREKIPPLVIQPNPEWAHHFNVKTTRANSHQAIAATERIWKKLFPNRVFEYDFLDETYEQMYQREQKTATLFNFFALITLLLSCLGLFGLATFMAERRTKEIGIRKVLGSSVWELVQLLTSDFVKLVLVASVLAFPLAYWAIEAWLQDFAYRTEVAWWIYAAAAFLTMLIAFATTAIQAVRAALANPVRSIRTE